MSMHKFIYIPVLLLFVFSPARAQEKKYVYVDSSLIKDEEISSTPQSGVIIAEPPVEDHTMNEPVTTDNEPDTLLYLNNLKVSPDSVQQWKYAKDFAYIKYIDSLLKDKQAKDKLKKNEPSKPPGSSVLDRLLSSTFLKVLLGILAGIFVLFVLYKLFLTEGVFKRQPKSPGPQTTEAEKEDIISESDYDARIDQAVRSENFRQAVRYHYLRSLHKLADDNLVELAPDKTNYQYVRELKDSRLQNDFAALTLNYEYIWYGEFEIGSSIYQKLETGFKNFNQQL